ncbi:putative protein kinase YPK3 NDAI_0A07190 [Naumovozyma dairenensis CBS 421]|uniref:Protein kinase domain-containing protein n=1 Tax=Naumovozyma dairenensis (strain ATCC 10597 / BCRC 20456 / CBS 421 / NBRC 0211 / NRRL Y-12639) TaxID=1071378 RepID=G0W4Y5_NAUDC|nr:hypothetical protein NDAI_0A07190 [Naumovozyma dairenensis CBS 421]CCD22873.1 hypothetical protein NDAI_0A07190 [Naumovozyma dairenensis CBS 421]
MIFALDEELQKLNLNPSTSSPSPGDIEPNLPTFHRSEVEETLETDDELDITNPPHLNGQPIPFTSSKIGTRRRSSRIDKFPVLTPTNVKHIPLTYDHNDDVVEEELERSSTHIDTLAIPIPSTTEKKNRKKSVSRTVRDFKPVRVLGQGAYGKVLLVKDKSSSKLYAMKQLRKAEILITQDVTKTKQEENEEDEEKKLQKRLERTFAERSILSELEHPNIVKLFYSFHDNSKLYLLLQYIPGGELFFHLKEYGTLDETTVAYYAAEISCALKFLHDKGIVYRDLKPENCLLNETGHLVLTDFGLSKKSVSQEVNSELNSEDTDTPTEQIGENVDTLHSIIGTPEYCAPEILKGLPYDRNCDWYSLGCLLYDMLSGKPPYTGVDHKVILNKIQKDKTGPKIPFYLSDGMKDMLTWLLKKDRSKRWDVDKYWAPIANNNKKLKKKNGKERTSDFQSHFIFRKIDWNLLESGELQKTTMGPIVPIITDLELAENFDSEFTSMSYENFDEDILNNDTNSIDMFQGFSYKASGSYLEKYF